MRPITSAAVALAVVVFLAAFFVVGNARLSAHSQAVKAHYAAVAHCDGLDWSADAKLADYARCVADAEHILEGK